MEPRRSIADRKTIADCADRYTMQTPKQRIQTQTLKTKLTLVIFGACIFVTALVMLFLINYEHRSLNRNILDTVKSEVLALNPQFVKMLLTGSIDEAADISRSLRELHHVLNIYVYNNNEEIVYEYNAIGTSQINPAPLPGPTGNAFDDQYIHINADVVYSGSKLGSVYLRALADIKTEKLTLYYRLLALLVPLVLAVSYATAAWLQRYFSNPIVELSDIIKLISRDNNFSRQVLSDRRDEVGDLYRGFNNLLRIIEDDKNKIAEYQRNLQRLVEQRTASMKQQADIIEQIHDAVFTTDVGGRILSLNNAACAMFGYPRDELLGLHFSVLFPQQNRTDIQQQILDPLWKKGALERETQLMRKDTSLFDAQLSLSALKDDKGDVTAIVFFSMDITSRKIAESLLQLKTDELGQANKELEAFSYSVSHDLRAPLRSIDGFSQLLLEDYYDILDKQGKDYLNRVRLTSKRMGALIDDILKLAQVGRRQLTRLPVNLSQLASSIIEQLKSAHPGRQVEIIIQDSLTAHGDEPLLRIALQNLLENAWKYTQKETHPRIEFGLSGDYSNNVYFVKDNGIGFDMKYADKLFGAFQRLHRSSDFEGTGVGLATVQRVIHRHGGRVWAFSALNKGATFYFTLNGEAWAHSPQNRKKRPETPTPI